MLTVAWQGEEFGAPSEFTLFCGEVSFRYQLVFAHVSFSFFVHSPVDIITFEVS